MDCRAKSAFVMEERLVSSFGSLKNFSVFLPRLRPNTAELSLCCQMDIETGDSTGNSQ